MKLTAKLIATTLLVMAVITILVGWIATSRERQLFKTEHEETAKLVAEQNRDQLINSWQQNGDDGVVRAVDSMSFKTSRVQVRWRWFKNQATQSDMGQESQAAMEDLSGGKMYTVMNVRSDTRSQSGRVHTYVPIVNANSKLGGLDVSDSAVAINRRVHTIWWTTIGAILALFVLFGLTVAWAGFRFVGKPLKLLVEKTEQAAEGDFTKPLVLKGNKDEFHDLANALNKMCSRLSQQQTKIEQETKSKIEALNQLRHTDRLQTVGQLSSGIAHELGTPLNVVLGHADLIASGKMTTDEVTESAETIRGEIKRMTGIVRQLLDFSRSKPAAHTHVDLNALMRSTIELLHSMSYKVNVNLLFDSNLAQARADANEDQLKQVFLNLIMNAVQAMPDGGNVQTRLELFENTQPPPGEDLTEEAGDYYCVSIQDQGVGISESQLDRIFEPFFTTKEVGSGTGLGLSIAYGIVKEHGGWIKVESEIGAGSCFRVFLPAQNG